MFSLKLLIRVIGSVVLLCTRGREYYVFVFLLIQDTDVVVRFCKDVESRSQTGYVDFGRYDKFNYFVAGSGHVDLVQEFYNGDLLNCEHTFDKMGRTAQVNIICGKCLNGQCKGQHGCICNVSYESTCRAIVELAIPCENPGPRVFEGFTVGFHPRSWEIVHNGLTQLGFEKSHPDFSFSTEQPHVTLYLTAIASQSNLVKKPRVKVFPENGLEVKLSGTAATGNPPTTLSPSTLLLDWRCVKACGTPYEVKITIPVEGYESIEFVLTKMCGKLPDFVFFNASFYQLLFFWNPFEYLSDSTQNQEEDATRGWAIFGIISCMYINDFINSILLWRVYLQDTNGKPGELLRLYLFLHGIDALPGMTVLSACLETVSGAGQGYSRVEEVNTGFTNEVSWERPSSGTQGTWTPSLNESKYGSM
ncbi:G-protein coupled receptor [Gossypium australe]|uniref:G-protein coupled receptor n=1 Tax=Gossypium australe TaxID=47621 RepID=A0A5B6UKW3_9ROSI|nr:G-protein coupled receptor [Gossypium australe]